MLRTWDYFLSFYFAANNHNYTRFGNWYFHQMKNLERYFPGLKVNLSVQAQGQYHLYTAVDQRGEQNLNKHARTFDRIKGFSGDNNVVTKWALGRSDQAKNLNALFRL